MPKKVPDEQSEDLVRSMFLHFDKNKVISVSFRSLHRTSGQ